MASRGLTVQQQRNRAAVIKDLTSRGWSFDEAERIAYRKGQ
jgi:hypothetical protein